MKIRGKLTIIRAPNKTVFFCFLMFYFPLVSERSSFVFLIGASGAHLQQEHKIKMVRFLPYGQRE